MRRWLIILLVVLVVVAGAVTAVGATTDPGWRDSQSILQPRDRLYVYCPTGVQTVRERPNVTIVTCSPLEAR